MVYQQTQTASESPIDGSSLIKIILDRKISALSEGIILSDNFIAEIESFIERNSLAKYHPEFVESNESCPRCLKAHMISLANKQNIGIGSMKILDSLIDEEIGHNGYYLDEGEVIPVQMS